jgi:response regulator of citrate/malate metabolism
MEMRIVKEMKNFEPSMRKSKNIRRGLNKVLIVEDDLALSNLLCEVIETFSPDAEIHMATSGEEAEYHLEREADMGNPPYDLVVADIFLEGEITGLDVWKTCDLNHPDTNILVTSSLPVEKFKSYLKNEDSCPPYLPKPFSLEECMATIHDFA